MSEEQNEQLQPQEESGKGSENQPVEGMNPEEKKVEQTLEESTEEPEKEKSADEIVEEIESEMASQSEKEDYHSDAVKVQQEVLEQWSLKQLTDEYRDLLYKYPVNKVRNALGQIKRVFDEKYQSLYREALEKYKEENGNTLGFHFKLPEKSEFDSLHREFKRRLADYREQYKQQLEENLKKKEEILQELRDLVLGKVSGSASFLHAKLNELRKEWNAIKNVPRNQYSHLWKTFKYWEEQFYEILKFDKEYREKIYAENLKKKQIIIEKAKKLLEMEDARRAFSILQELHRDWKEKTGPVAEDIKEEIWQEFKNLTKQIHDRKKAYDAEMKKKYVENLEKKREIIEKIKALTGDEEINEHAKWQALIKEVEALREAFFSIGHVPRNAADSIRNEFYQALRDFNRKKNAFYKALKQKQKENLKLKRNLIEEVKQLQANEDLQAAFDRCQQIREEWRQIGFVPRGVSDKIWEEFRSECKKFMDYYYSQSKSLQDEAYQNYLKKKEYLAQLKAKLKEGQLDNITKEDVNEILKEWKAIGRVPDNVRFINNKFNRFITSLYRKLNLDENEIRLMDFRNRIKSYLAEDDYRSVNKERRIIRDKIDRLEKEIGQAENNLLFFKSSDENNPLLKNLKDKINRQRSILELFKQKLALIDQLEEETENEEIEEIEETPEAEENAGGASPEPTSDDEQTEDVEKNGETEEETGGENQPDEEAKD